MFLKERDGFREFVVESLTPYKNAHTLKLRGVDSISDALMLAGRDIFGVDEDIAPPADDEFVIGDLAGCRVETKDGRLVGRVRTVWETGGTPLLVLDPEERKDEIYVPFNRTICLEIDVRAKRIVVDPPDGLLDLNEI
ncbi:MAG: ribosome maturation factor RimM [Candidatus Aminicenantes bacterium]|nr:ribosome maturation factor RimM [Candidatus Aminicenantes bacterium]